MRRVAAVLFDLDGVLVESREATERVWLDWAARNGIDEEELRSAMHGVRSVEVVPISIRMQVGTVPAIQCAVAAQFDAATARCFVLASRGRRNWSCTV